MPADKAITVDIDLSGLPAPNAVITACETEDEIGCILRMQFLVEQVVDFYFVHFAPEAVRSFIQPVWEFRHKLDRAVLLGLPIPFANAAKMLAKIRNDAAHGKLTINTGHLDNLIGRVDFLVSIVPDFIPLHKRWLQLPGTMPGEVIRLKSHTLRFDFIIASMALYAELHKWVAQQAILRAATHQ